MTYCCLHPYDATHIIGIGKETATNDWGGGLHDLGDINTTIATVPLSGGDVLYPVVKE